MEKYHKQDVAPIEKVVVHEKTKVDEHYRQTVEIFYNFVGAIDRPIWGNELSDDDDWNQQTAREKAWHYATPDSEPCAFT